MNLRIIFKSLIIDLIILQEVSSEHYEFSSGISNYQKLNIQGNYSYLASMCEGELFMTDLCTRKEKLSAIDLLFYY